MGSCVLPPTMETTWCCRSLQRELCCGDMAPRVHRLPSPCQVYLNDKPHRSLWQTVSTARCWHLNWFETEVKLSEPDSSSYGGYLTFALELLLCNCCEGIQAVNVKFWINHLHLGKKLYHIDLVILLDRSLCIGLSLCGNPKTDWWPVRGVPCLWTYSSWDRLQPLLPRCVHKHWTLTFLPVAAVVCRC